MRAWRELRHRLLSSAGFREWASRFWLTKPIAKRRALEVFDLCAGFVYSQILFACVQLGVFAHLDEKPLSLSGLSDRLGLELEATERLVQAAESLRLLETRKVNQQIMVSLGDRGSVIYSEPGLIELIKHHSAFYRDLEEPTKLLNASRQPGELQRFWRYAMKNSTKQSASESVFTDEISTQVDPVFKSYSDLMAISNNLIATIVLSEVNFNAVKAVLDIGGGKGAFLSYLASKFPHLHLALFDLPDVAPLAEESLIKAGLKERSKVYAGNFLTDDLPRCADLITLLRVVHDHNDEVIEQLFRKCWRSLPEGGRLLIAEPMRSTSNHSRVGDAYFNFYLLAMGQGRARSPERITTMLKSAGFKKVVHWPGSQPLQAEILQAHK